MIRYTCDRCGRDLSNGAHERFEVFIDVRPTDDSWQLTEEDVDDDNLAKMSKMLDELEAKEDMTDYADTAPLQIRFDLCASCRAKFLDNPLNRPSSAKLKFSEN